MSDADMTSCTASKTALELSRLDQHGRHSTVPCISDITANLPATILSEQIARNVDCVKIARRNPLTGSNKVS